MKTIYTKQNTQHRKLKEEQHGPYPQPPQKKTNKKTGVNPGARKG